MVDFTRHTIESAPEGAKPLLHASQAAYGMIPNLHAVMAESPQHLEAYRTLADLFSKSSLSTTEQHVVMLAINVENRCHYCVPAHSFLALKDEVPAEVVEALRNDDPLPDANLETLRTFAKKVVIQRGVLSTYDLEAFFNAGFTQANLLDVILAVGYKTLSNYVNHIAQTPVDAPFAKHDWTPPAVQAAE